MFRRWGRVIAGCVSVVAIAGFLGAAQSAWYMLNNFERTCEENVTRGRDTVIGETEGPQGKGPRAHAVLIHDEVRGAALKISYDARDGAIGYRMALNASGLFPLFNAVKFYVKSDADTLLVRLQCQETHEYVVQNVVSAWTEIEIPFSRFSKPDLLVPAELTSLEILVERTRLEQTTGEQGTLYLDDIALTKAATEGTSVGELPPPSSVMRINGTTVHTTRPYVGDELELTAKYSYDRTSPAFLGIRFEASTDKKHWFFVGEDTDKRDTFFTVRWRIGTFDSGTYQVRAVALYAPGEYIPGRPVRIRYTQQASLDQLLDQLERKSCSYFLREYFPASGLTRESTAPDAPASLAGSGIALSCYALAAERGYVSREDMVKRITRALETLTATVPTVAGFYPERVSEQGAALDTRGNIPTTAMLVAGAEIVASYFNHETPEERALAMLARKLIRTVRWHDALVEHHGRRLLARFIEAPGKNEGVLEGFGDGMLAYVLAVASPADRLDPVVWQDWAASYTTHIYGPYRYVAAPCIDAYAVPLLWLDLRHLRDQHMQYGDNAITAYLVNRESSLRANDSYPAELWGAGPCIGPNGFRAYTFPVPRSVVNYDGTLAPAAAGSAIAVIPVLGKAALYACERNQQPAVDGKYGLYDAYTIRTSYAPEHYTAVNTGMLVMSIENYRSQFFWKSMMKSPHITRALRAMGLVREK